jgi:hypothetical protein
MPLNFKETSSFIDSLVEDIENKKMKNDAYTHLANRLPMESDRFNQFLNDLFHANNVTARLKRQILEEKKQFEGLDLDQDILVKNAAQALLQKRLETQAYLMLKSTSLHDYGELEFWLAAEFMLLLYAKNYGEFVDISAIRGVERQRVFAEYLTEYTNRQVDMYSFTTSAIGFSETVPSRITQVLKTPSSVASTQKQTKSFLSRIFWQ